MGDARRNWDEQDQRAMMRALDLARLAAGKTAPNPMVGCVIVKDGKTIGEGWHAGPGLDHAEVMALKSAGGDVRGATAYVTLEPCNHTGRTGPCTAALIDAEITSVIFAMEDPNPLAAGGASALRAAGITVHGGLLEQASRELNRAWLCRLDYRRPYITAKSAMSLDGRIATASGESQWITAAQSRNAGHRLRHEADAIIVGAETVIADDPALTARADDGVAYPLRVVLDSQGRTPVGAKVYERSGRGAVLMAAPTFAGQRRRAFEEMGTRICAVETDHSGRPNPDGILDALYERDIAHAMIEGGGAVIGSFFDADLIDELHLFIAPKILGGGKPAFGGDGIAALSQSNRFDLQQQDHDGPDQYWIARRNREAD